MQRLFVVVNPARAMFGPYTEEQVNNRLAMYPNARGQYFELVPAVLAEKTVKTTVKEIV